MRVLFVVGILCLAQPGAGQPLEPLLPAAWPAVVDNGQAQASSTPVERFSSATEESETGEIVTITQSCTVRNSINNHICNGTTDCVPRQLFCCGYCDEDPFLCGWGDCT